MKVMGLEEESLVEGNKDNSTLMILIISLDKQTITIK
jgi:hypothetical protein